MVHFGSFYKIPLFILFCSLLGCQYFGVGIIFQSLLTTNYHKPIIDGKSEMTDTPDTIASKRTKGNNQSLVVPLCSLYSF